MRLSLWVCLAVASAPGRARAQSPLALRDAVERAVARNERAEIALQELAAAEARLRRARSLFYPEVTFTGSYRHTPALTRALDGTALTLREGDTLAGALQGRLTVFDARSFPLYGAARLDRDAQQLASAEARRRLAFDAADAFLVTLGAEQVLAAAERRVELARRVLEDARARRRAALVSTNDVTKAELELATAEREIARARAEAASARLSLGHLVGGPVGGALVPPADLADPRTVAPPETLIARARRLRMDAAAARLRTEVADRLAAEPLLRAAPTVALVGQYSATSSPGFAGRDRDWFVGADLAWTLYDGGERYAERDERKAVARVAELDASWSARTVDLEVRQALVIVEAARRAGERAGAAAAAARRNAEEVAALYREGLATALDVADASARAYEADVALVGDEYALGRGVLGLRAALGVDPAGREVAR